MIAPAPMQYAVMYRRVEVLVSLDLYVADICSLGRTQSTALGYASVSTEAADSDYPCLFLLAMISEWLVGEGGYAYQFKQQQDHSLLSDHCLTTTLSAQPTCMMTTMTTGDEDTDPTAQAAASPGHLDIAGTAASGPSKRFDA